MENNLLDELIIIPKPDYITWEEISELLHLGYSQRAKEGLHYSAVDQPVEKTIERVGDGVCLVALLNGKLVGTESYKLIEKSKLNFKKWYYDERFYYLHSLTVHPDFTKQGIGSKIRNTIKQEAIKNNIDSLISDTAIHAKWLIKWYDRQGHKKVGLVSHPTTNYYSVVMRTPIKGKNYSNFYRFIRYNLSLIRCVILRKTNGQLRTIPSLIKKTIMK